MTTEATNPNPNPSDAPADAAATAEDTALAAAAKADTADETASGEVAVENGGEQAGVGEGAAEQEQAAAGAPDTYDTAAFTMPDGVEFDQEGFEAIEPTLREIGLSQDQAGKLMHGVAEKVAPLIAKRTTDAFDESAAQLRADLARDLQADEVVGGKHLDESKALSAKAIAHALPKGEDRDEFSTFLNESGLGNNRFLMRVLAASGRALSEARTPASEGSGEQITESQKFYGKG